MRHSLLNIFGINLRHLLLQALLFSVGISMMGSCSKGTKVFSMKQSGATEVDVNAAVDGSGNSTGRISRDANASQRINAADGSGIEGGQVLFPAGALAIDADVTLGQGASVADSVFAGVVGAGGFTVSGVALSVSASPPTDTINPMTLMIPGPSSSSLALTLAGDESWVVIFESQRVGESGKFYSGLIPRSEFTVKDGMAVLTAKFFGTYQVVVPKTPVTKRVDIEGKVKEISAKKFVPPPQLTPSKSFNAAFQATISGSAAARGSRFTEYRYTTDGSSPSCSSGSSSTLEPVPVPISPSVSMTLKAVTCNTDGEASAVVVATYTYDNVPPTVSISGPDLIWVNSKKEARYTITYDGASLVKLGTDDIIASVSAGSNATANIRPITRATANSYTLLLNEFKGDGLISFSVSAGTATDAAGNTAAASASSAVLNVDNTRPEAPFIASDIGSTYSSTYNGTKSFTFSSTDSALKDFRVKIGTAPSSCTDGVSVSGSSYDVTGTMDLRVFVVACDRAGNMSDSISRDLTYDNTPPAIVSTSSDPVSPGISRKPTIRATLSEDAGVKLFKNDCIDASKLESGSSISSLSLSSDSGYTLTTDLAANVTTSIKAILVDAAGNQSLCLNLISYRHDTIAPTVVSFKRELNQASNVNALPVNFTLEFSEPINPDSFVGSDINNVAGGATVSTWSVSSSSVDNKVWLVSATAAGNGRLKPTLVASAITDVAGNTGPSAAFSATEEVSYNSGPLTVTVNKALSQPDPTNVNTISFDIQFSAPVTDASFDSFKTQYIVNESTFLSATSGTSVAWTWTKVDAQKWSLKASGFNSSGEIKASIAANSVTDIYGNSNAASTSTDNIVIYDNLPPSLPTVVTPNSILSASRVLDKSATIAWTSASDTVTTSSNIVYQLRMSDASTNPFTSVTNAKTSGLVKMTDTKNATSFSVNGLTANTGYWFALLAQDEAGNQVLYPPIWLVTYANCGSIDNKCYDSTTAMSRGRAVLPDNSTAVEYVNANSTCTGNYCFKIWKEVDGTRILKATGVWYAVEDWQKRLTRFGADFATTTFSYASAATFAGRACPNNVFLNFGNMAVAGQCVYYDTGTTAAISLSSRSGVNSPTIGEDCLDSWDDEQTGKEESASWYEGNIKTCADKGMRLPTLYETSAASPTSGGNFTVSMPTDGSVIGLTAPASGVPSVSNTSFSWTASAAILSGGSSHSLNFFNWKSSVDSSVYSYDYSSSTAHVRCVLPSSFSILITSQPTDKMGAPGGSVTFTVAASVNGSLSGLSYKWQYATQSQPTSFSDISSGTNSSYTLPALTTGQTNFRYRVKITAPGALQVISNAAKLTVGN